MAVNSGSTRRKLPQQFLINPGTDNRAYRLTPTWRFSFWLASLIAIEGVPPMQSRSISYVVVLLLLVWLLFVCLVARGATATLPPATLPPPDAINPPAPL